MTYLKGIANLNLLYQVDYKPIEGYTDANWSKFKSSIMVDGVRASKFCQTWPG